VRRAEILCAAALLLLAAVVVREAIRLGAGWGPAGPRAGFFPFWLAVILAACSLVNLGRGVRSGGQGTLLVPSAVRSVLALFLPMLAAFALLDVLGFYVTAALYLAFFSRWMGRHAWVTVAAVSLLFPVAVLLVIERWFLIPLPKGALGDGFLFF
jgi:hypothetical protein